MSYPFHRESSGLVKASMEEAFAAIDTHSQLSAHMGRRSAMMGGGAMTLEMDALEGRAVGAHIRLWGSVFGLRVEVDEVVTERDPPRHKAWETQGTPRLLVIAGYRMGVDVIPENGACRIRVFIDYALPRQGVGRWLGAVFGHRYARWCTASMLSGIRKHFRA